MKPRLPSSRRSSPACAPVELVLPTAPWFAALLAFQAVGVPVLLLGSSLAHGALAATVAVALAVVAAPAAARLCLLRGPEAPRRLRFTPEGDLWLDMSGGRSEPVGISRRSLVAGPWWLLILAEPRGRHAVLIETARVDPATRAALSRCLRRLATAPPESALR